MEHRKPTFQTRLKLSEIRTDGGTQMREALSDVRVAEYAERMLAGDSFPRIDVFYDGTDYWVADGFTRIAASKIAGVEEIDCLVHHGTLREAILFSLRANAMHGLNLTMEDKRKKAIVVLTDKEWCMLTTKQMVEIARIPASLISKTRQELAQVQMSQRLYGVDQPADFPSKPTSDIEKMARERIGSEEFEEKSPAKRGPRNAQGINQWPDTDQLGNLVTDPALVDVFKSIKRFKEVRRSIAKAVRDAKELATLPGGKVLQCSKLCGYLRMAASKVIEAEPYCICDWCADKDDPLCEKCGANKWIGRMAWKLSQKQESEAIEELKADGNDYSPMSAEAQAELDDDNVDGVADDSSPVPS